MTKIRLFTITVLVVLLCSSVALVALRGKLQLAISAGIGTGPASSFLLPPPSAPVTGAAHSTGTHSNDSTSSYHMPKIAAVVLTHHENHDTRVRAIMNTWGRHVDVVLLASDSDVGQDRYPALRALRKRQDDLLGAKMLGAVRYVCEMHNLTAPRKRGNASHATPRSRSSTNNSGMNDAYDFYLVTDDDTFVIVPNLEKVLRLKNPHAHLYTGYLLKHTKPPFIGGGGGIVLSHKTMTAVCGAMAHGRSRDACHTPVRDSEYAGDTALLSCLMHVGVAAEHTEGFYPFPLDAMVREKDNFCNITWWFSKSAMECPPIRHAISFHYIPPERFKEYYYWTYTFAKQ